MVKAKQVLSMLCPDVQWTIDGEDYEGIIWHDGNAAITKKQFTDGFAKFDAWKSEQDSNRTNAKTELLDRLGITAEEAQLLLS